MSSSLQSYPTPDLFDQLSFRHTWRPYQKRVLDEIVGDGPRAGGRKLHIVAAPGSGKTTLGIEIARRLGKPVLVLSPTRTIRDQWIDRLRDFCTETSDAWPPPWTSADLQQPTAFTSITYQALLVRHRAAAVREIDEAEEPTTTDLASDGQPDNRLEAAPEQAGEASPPRVPSDAELADAGTLLLGVGVGTLILDEAHHLRAEWWKALNALAERLPGVNIVSLTATPPYDVVGAEWDRYHDLCGSIDEEISVPELVSVGTLAPHQDYVWTVMPLKSERERLLQYESAVANVLWSLAEDATLVAAVQAHPWLEARGSSQSLVAEDPQTAAALLVFLRVRNLPLPAGLMNLLDLDADAVPAMDRSWWQTLIKSYLFDNHWSQTKARLQHRDALARRLRAAGLLWRHELRLEESRLIKSQLSLSGAKVQACVQIHALERQHRRDSLRQVVLTDFIREEETDTPVLGAIPIFKALATALNGQAHDLALLTGRVVLAHASQVKALAESGLTEVMPCRLQGLEDFVQVRASISASVAALTRMLASGQVRTLIGTRALLGEGWDAPVINSLVLASFVGSYMMTNQMRGRAIRVDPTQPRKASSIWHIVAVVPDAPSGYADLSELRLRFRMFVGLSERQDVVESGLARLTLPYLDARANLKPLVFKGAWSDNSVMSARLADIGSLRERWQRAISRGEAGKVRPMLRVMKPPRVAPYWFGRTLRWLLIQIQLGFLSVYSLVFGNLGQAAKLDEWSVSLAVGVAAAIASLYVLPRLLRTGWIWIKHLPIDGSVEQIGLALRDALCSAELIRGTPGRFPVVSRRDADGSITLSLDGGSFHDQSLFTEALDEILGPIKTPRYLLVRYGGRRKTGRHDYHAVPQSLGLRKPLAMELAKAWERRVGPVDLVQVRGTEGKQLLARARARSFANAMQASGERFDRWQ